MERTRLPPTPATQFQGPEGPKMTSLSRIQEPHSRHHSHSLGTSITALASTRTGSAAFTRSPWKLLMLPALEMSRSNVRFRYLTTSGEYSDSPVAVLPLPNLPDVERLSPSIIRVLGGNPSKFTLQGTNTYLVGKGSKRILIDTGQGKPIWIKNLQKVLAEENATVDSVIITHRHFDHVGGIADLRKISPDIQIFKNEARKGEKELVDGHIFKVEGTTLRALHTPGHTTDHMALVLEEEDAIFTGDNVLGHGTAVFEDLAIYLDSLRRMAAQVSGRGYPAHGAVIDDAKSKITEYILHRQGRENQILEILSRQKDAELSSESPDWTTLDVVKFIYTELSPDMYPAAEQGVRLVLDKLEKEIRVSHDVRADVWRLTTKATL